MRVKTQNAVLSKRFNQLQKDIDDQKEFIQNLSEKKTQLELQIEGLKKEINGLKKEVRLRFWLSVLCSQ